MEPPKLLVQEVSKIYKDGHKILPTLASIDLQVNTGEFVTVIGPSGCGKSTLFNIVAGVDQPTTGLVAIDGDSSGMRTGKAGYMPHCRQLSRDALRWYASTGSFAAHCSVQC